MNRKKKMFIFFRTLKTQLSQKYPDAYMSGKRKIPDQNCLLCLKWTI